MKQALIVIMTLYLPCMAMEPMDETMVRLDMAIPVEQQANNIEKSWEDSEHQLFSVQTQSVNERLCCSQLRWCWACSVRNCCDSQNCKDCCLASLSLGAIFVIIGVPLILRFMML